MRRLSPALMLSICFLALISLAAAGAYAQVIPDPPVFIGNSTCPDSSCSNFFNGETIGVPGTGLTIYDQGKNSSSISSPFLLIISVPNVTNLSFAAPSITVTNGPGVTGTPTGTLGGANIYQGTWNTTTGYSGQLGSGQNIYDVTQLQASGDGSQSFANYSQWDANSSLGINASTFAVYVYTISGVTLNQGQYVTVDFGSSLPTGTFAAAYGCEPGNSTSTGCPGGQQFSTPFTHAGIVTTVTSTPEPPSLSLLAIGLGGLLLAMLRRRPLINI